MLRRTFVASALAAAPGIALAQTTGSTRTPSTTGDIVRRPTGLVQPIVPETELERTFLAAFSNEDMRSAFRRQFLESNVVLALATSASDSPPLERPLPNDQRMTFIFTSAARADSVMGPAAPRRAMSGRAALERVRGKYLLINYTLEPMLTLEPDDIDRFLALPRTAARSAGPSQ
jgi:hypothetical protein